MNPQTEYNPTAWEKNLLTFARALRSLGIRVSSAETMEALRALEMISIMDRNAVKTALKATMIKDPEKVPVFEQAFEIYFAVPEEKERLDAQREEKAQAEEMAIEKAETELVFQGESLEMSTEDKLLYAHLNEAQQQKLQDFLRKTSEGKNVNNKFQPLVESLVQGHLNYWKRNIQNPDIQMPPPAKTGEDEVDNLVSDVHQEISREEMSILYQDMQNIKDEDFPKVARAINRLSRKLATRISRRYHRTNRPDKIDIRKSIRENIRYGGTMLNLKYKSKKVQKPSLLLICDVSGSMARYAAFVLQFVYGLANVTKKIESFAFSEDLEKITHLFTRKKPFEETMSEVMNQSEVWGEGTDLNRSLSRLSLEHRKLLTSNTVLIIVSDTKTLKAEDAVSKLKTIGRTVKEVLWLNTLPETEWSEHRTVDLFSRHSQMYCCNTLAHLERILHSKLL